MNINLILSLKIPDLTFLLEKRKNLSYINAIEIIYNSAMYSTLEREETKLWHLSNETLYEILINEIDNNIIDYPEEA